MAVLGEKRSLKGSLRSDENMLEVWGIEGALDNESLTMDAAVCLLGKTGIDVLVYVNGARQLAVDFLGAAPQASVAQALPAY
jgi:hypothetical protein